MKRVRVTTIFPLKRQQFAVLTSTCINNLTTDYISQLIYAQLGRCFHCVILLKDAGCVYKRTLKILSPHFSINNITKPAQC